MPDELAQVIEESLKLPTIEEAVSHMILPKGLTKGSQVAVLDDPIYGYNGLIGTVEGPAGKDGMLQSGFYNIRFENGVSVPLQATLLVPV